tara:strand:- start:71 stop:622 length:552 start_codon:yes stop_codon:yes gene_type:complete
MSKYKFEEEVVVEEETAVTEENVEESPDQHDAFVNLLVDMGLSAEQAEAVHSMAMDLIDAGGGEEITEEVSTEEKVEASRQRRSKFARRSRRSNNVSSTRPARSEMSETQMTQVREQRATRRLRRQNIELRKQLRELGASPAASGLRNAPNMKQENFSSAEVGTKTLGKSTSQALDMINNYGK